MTKESSPSSEPSSTQVVNVPQSEQLDPVIAEMEEQIQNLVMRKVTYEGPYPPPSMLAEYNQIVPGSADRLITMAEEEQKHRQQLETQDMQSFILEQKETSKARTRGQWLGAGILALALLLAAIIGLRSPDSPVAIALVGMAVAAAVVALVTGLRTTPDNNNQDDDDNDS